MDRKLTDNDWEVLRGLWNEPASGVAPLMFGGSNGSHHSNTARKLCDQPEPLVERRFRGGEWGGKKRYASRGSCVYRLTPLGVRVVEFYHPTWSARRRPEAVQPESQ